MKYSPPGRCHILGSRVESGIIVCIIWLIFKKRCLSNEWWEMRPRDGPETRRAQLQHRSMIIRQYSHQRDRDSWILFPTTKDYFFSSCNKSWLTNQHQETLNCLLSSFHFKVEMYPRFLWYKIRGNYFRKVL